MQPTTSLLSLLPIFAALLSNTALAAPAVRDAVGAGDAIFDPSVPFQQNAVTTSSKATLSLGRGSVRSTSVTSSAAATTSPVAATGPSDIFSKDILAAHNKARSTHGAGNLVWAQDLVDAAKNWSDACVFKHGGNTGIQGGAGQNLAAGASTASAASQSGQQVVDLWMAEEKDYNPSSPMYSHFTQVVWKGSQELGCYQSVCDAKTFKDGSGNLVFPTMKSVVFTTCNYRRPGNVQGQYAANVQKII